MDDVILTENFINDSNQYKTTLHSKFTIMDIWPLKYFLSLEVPRSSKATIISQTKFILDVLKDASMMHCKSAPFPLP